jgi:hypothetical protein
VSAPNCRSALYVSAQNVRTERHSCAESGAPERHFRVRYDDLNGQSVRVAAKITVDECGWHGRVRLRGHREPNRGGDSGVGRYRRPPANGGLGPHTGQCRVRTSPHRTRAIGTCPTFFLACLYTLGGDAIRTAYKALSSAELRTLLTEAEGTRHPWLTVWCRRVEMLMTAPESFNYADWCGGGLARNPSGA